MAVTPNYSWPVPVATDLVKDGYAAIADLGDAIDATVFGLPSAGISLISTTTLSAVATQSVNDVFSATYDNYLIMLGLTGSTTNQDVSMRLRVAGADNSSANYNRSLFGQASTTLTGQRLTAQTQFASVANVESGTKSYAQLTMFNPFLVQTTALISEAFEIPNGNISQRLVMYGTTVTTSYTGFTIFPASGTITGTISVYGYKD